MIDLDELTPDQIEKAIRWSQQDDFWAPNIQSMPTVREKFEKLRAAAIQRPAGRTVVAVRNSQGQRQNETNEFFERAMERAQAREASGL